MRAKPVLHHLLRLIGLTPLLFSFCIPVLADTEVGGVIDEDTTWGPPEDTVYIVVESVIVQYGATLTILPGVTVKFDSSLSLYVRGVLAAAGTEEDEILFTSNSAEPAPGDWGAIRFEGAGASGSSVEHVTIEYGGSGSYLTYIEQGALVCCDGGASPGFAHCVLRHSLGVGLAAGLVSWYPAVHHEVSAESCEFVDNTGYGVAASPCAVPAMTACHFAGNAYDAVLVVTSNSSHLSCIVGDSAWANPGVPYHVVNYAAGYGGVYVNHPDTLTIEPGCVLKFGAVGSNSFCAGLFTYRNWGYQAPAGGTRAEGSPENPIIFTTIEEQPEMGFFIFLGGVGDGESDIPSIFRNCSFENMSFPPDGDVHYLGMACWYNRQITFEDCAFRPRLTGLGLQVWFGAADMIGCTFEECDYIALLGYQYRGGLISGNTFVGGRNGVCGNELGFTITENVFIGTSGYPIRYYPGSVFNPLIFNNTYLDCAKQAIGIGADCIRSSAVWRKDSVPYEVYAVETEWGSWYDVSVQYSATLTIEPGVEVRFRDRTGLVVGDPSHATPERRRGSLIAVGSAEQPIRFTEELGSVVGWSGILLDGRGQEGEYLPSIMEYCVVDHAGADGSPAIDILNHNNVSISRCTVTASSSSGLTCKFGAADVSDSIFALNAGHGIAALGSAITIDYCDVWGNDLGDYGGEAGPGVGCISEDPEFFDWEMSDYTLTCASPCIDTGDPDAPPVDGTRLDMGAQQFGGLIAAPETEPYCEGPLFGPGWVWFSIPLDPDECCGEENCYDPNTLLGFDCGGTLWYFDKYIKATQVYQPPFLEWNLMPGDSYLLRLGFEPDQVSYIGANPPHPFEFKLGRTGWTWVGMPRGMPIAGSEFMDTVSAKYPSDEMGEVRTARDDWSSGDPWVSWGWTFFDTARQAPKAFTPYAPFGNTDCYPWLGYRVWVHVGGALSEEEPDQVTLIWP